MYSTLTSLWMTRYILQRTLDYFQRQVLWHGSISGISLSRKLQKDTLKGLLEYRGSSLRVQKVVRLYIYDFLASLYIYQTCRGWKLYSQSFQSRQKKGQSNIPSEYVFIIYLIFKYLDSQNSRYSEAPYYDYVSFLSIDIKLKYFQLGGFKNEILLTVRHDLYLIIQDLIVDFQKFNW